VRYFLACDASTIARILILTAADRYEVFVGASPRRSTQKRAHIMYITLYITFRPTLPRTGLTDLIKSNWGLREGLTSEVDPKMGANNVHQLVHYFLANMVTMV
jgi:hypothetical protein